jgi:2-iminobutanoate/2-iminopropanoate deaminase
MSNVAIATDRAPAAIGPYSQAVRVGDLVFTSGQIGLDPATGEMVAGGVEAEARRVLDNLTAVLEAAGAGWSNVVRTTIYLTDIGDFALVNRLYGERVSAGGGVLPARSTVQVARLPRGGVVEIDAVAHVRRATAAE